MVADAMWPRLGCLGWRVVCVTALRQRRRGGALVLVRFQCRALPSCELRLGLQHGLEPCPMDLPRPPPLPCARPACAVQIFETKPTLVKNYGIWVRYESRTGTHNMYKEYRDVTLNGAVAQMYQEMASRHRVRFAQVQIIKTATVDYHACKRDNTKQFHNESIKFPITHKLARATAPEYKTLYKASRPSVAMF